MRYHLIWGTYGSWLPGDPRGFRTRHHRRHVEGDYKHPPPPGLFEGLHAYAKRSLKKPPVTIGPDLRETVGRWCLWQFANEKATVLVLSVGAEHVHVAADCPMGDLKQVVGRVKKVSSHRVRDRLPGRVWQAGCSIIPVRREAHWRNVLHYIATGQGPGAWVWLKPGLVLER